MAVYVDPIQIWPHAKHPFLKGSCHLGTDGHLDELHAFALKLGMRKIWFQNHPIAPHYDLVPSRRTQAVALGAIEVTCREFLAKTRSRPRTAP